MMNQKHLRQVADNPTNMKQYNDAKLSRGMSAEDDSDGGRTDVEDNINEKVKGRCLNGLLALSL